MKSKLLRSARNYFVICLTLYLTPSILFERLKTGLLGDMLSTHIMTALFIPLFFLTAVCFVLGPRRLAKWNPVLQRIGSGMLNLYVPAVAGCLGVMVGSGFMLMWDSGFSLFGELVAKTAAFAILSCLPAYFLCEAMALADGRSKMLFTDIKYAPYLMALGCINIVLCSVGMFNVVTG